MGSEARGSGGVTPGQAPGSGGVTPGRTPAGEPLVLGIDLGTTHVKAGLFTRTGRLLDSRAARYRQGSSGLTTEQDPDAWWDAVAGAIKGLADTGGRGADVAAVCCVGQGPTLVAVDTDLRAVRPAICWSDPRPRREQAELARALGRDGFGLGLLPKIRWLHAHEPEAYGRARWFMGAWDYVAMRLSGTPATARSPAGTETTPELAAEAGLDAGRIPPSRPWAQAIGTVGPAIAGAVGLSERALVVTGTNDGLGAYVGAGLLEPGQAVDTGGTSGGFAVTWTDTLSLPGVFSVAGPAGGTRIFGGAMAATGRSLDWLHRDALGLDGSLDALLAEAGAAPPGAGHLLFLPYLTGERAPVFDADARGAFVGLDVRHGRGHLARAVLESAAYALRHVATPMLAAGAEVTELRVCGSTARSELWNRVKADVTGFPVAVPAVPQTGTLGAAVLAAVGAGMHGSVEEAMRAMTAVRARIEPDPEHRDLYDELFELYVDLYPRLAPVFDRLAGLRAREAEAWTSR